MPVFVKGYMTKVGKAVKAYSRNSGFKKGLSKTGRIQKAINKISGDLGWANTQGNAKRARTLHKRMNKVRTYMIAHRL